MGRNGQVTIPAEFRRRLGLQPKDKLEVTADAEGLRLRPIRSVVDTTAGTGRSTRSFSDEEIEAALEAERVDQWLRK
ncbi:MAG: AbrB/MazE/SpoVT family DNA-binding domain-containing protein, partial [Chloroflexota bacterium]